MELSSDFIHGLQSLGDTAKVDNASFELILQLALESILSPDSVQDIEKQVSSSALDKAQLNLALVSTAAFLLEATKLDRDGTSLRQMLEELHFDGCRLENVIKLYEEKKVNIRQILKNVSRSYPHITDIKWKVEYYLKVHSDSLLNKLYTQDYENNHLHKVAQPQFSIQLCTQEPGESRNETFHFSCSQEQLQDMVGKLKEACKSLERAVHGTQA